MKKFNLLKEIIIVDKSELLQAINSQKEFGIKIDGSITYEPQKEIVIFIGKHTPTLMALAPAKPLKLEDFFGTSYRIVETEEKVAIKASLAWQDIIKLNYDKAMYDDTSGDGVAEFADKDLEDIGWHADEFEITYRELVEVLEEQAEGLLLCIEQEGESYHFSGLGFIDDPKEAYAILYEYAKERIAQKMKEDPLYASDKLSDDEAEAARYFSVLQGD